MPRRHRGRGKKRHGRRAVRMLEPVLLLLLHRRPAHGYTLLEQTDEFRLGDFDSSMVYRALRDMEEKAWVTSTWDEGRPDTNRLDLTCLQIHAVSCCAPRLWATGSYTHAKSAPDAGQKC